jgi:hypothetical protein
MTDGISEQSAKASNLLWRWEMHIKGLEALRQCCPDFHDERWDPVCSDNYRTYTDRLMSEIANGRRAAAKGMSEAAANLTSFAPRDVRWKGDYVSKIPEETREALKEWLKEHQFLLEEMGMFFVKYEHDMPHEPYQRCIREASHAAYKLRTHLIGLFEPPAEAAE